MTTCSFEGGVKFFNESVALLRDGATATATSNSDNAKVILTNDRRLVWESIGSSDTNTQTIEITFPQTETINRIYLGEHNFKSFNVKYDDSSVWKDIILTKGVDGSFEYTEKLTNNTFENGTTGWSVTSGTIAQDADVPGSGATIPYSILWQNATLNSFIRQVSPRFSTIAGATYKITAWAKGDAGATFRLVGVAGDNIINYFGPIAQLQTYWQKYTFIYTDVPGGNLAFFALQALEAGGITNLYMALPSVKEWNPIDTAYYEFSDISTSKIQINCTTTQVANAEKRLTSALAMTEIGQFNLFPDISSIGIDRNEDRKKTLSEKELVQKGFKTRKFNIGFSSYFEQDDVDLMAELFEREENFYVWLAAGKYGTDYFKPIFEPFRLQDLITMQTIGNIDNSYTKNYYKGGINTTLNLTEVVG